jgi:plastocyanin
MRLTRFLTAAGVVIVAGCGSGMSSSSSTSSTSSSPQVTIQDFSFKPSTLTVKAGTKVTWINSGPSAHTVTSDTMVFQSADLSGPTAGDPYGGGGMPGASFQFTFNTPGTYAYHCSLHPPSSYPGFTGTIVVTQ